MLRGEIRKEVEARKSHLYLEEDEGIETIHRTTHTVGGSCLQKVHDLHTPLKIHSQRIAEIPDGALYPGGHLHICIVDDAF